MCYMKEFRLTEHEVMSLSSRMPTPFMVASTDKIEENYRFMRHHLPHAGIYYAIKANPTPAILKRLIGLGAHFDVASAGEMALLHGMGVDGSRMIYANTVKNISGLKMAAKIGLNRFTFDEETEIDKMAAYVPGADVLLRISVHNSKAKVDLNTKFGAPPSMACELLMKARDKGLNPIGICFHVGSQSFSTAAYEEALLLCHGIFDEAKRMGLNLTDLDIGGGFPVPSLDYPHVDPAPMMDAIDRQIVRLFPNTAVWTEPGRFICGTAVNLVASVIGTRSYGDEPWYIIDESIYGSFSGIMYDHWAYPFTVFGHGEVCPSTFAGPTCDGIDVLYRSFQSPRLSIGDKVLATNIGAYSTVSATRFNGFEIAPTVIWEEQPECLSRKDTEKSSDERISAEAI